MYKSETGVKHSDCLRIMVDELFQKRIKCFETQKNIFKELLSESLAPIAVQISKFYESVFMECTCYTE